MPTISVVIPVYKVENTLSRCIDSVLWQTYTDYEIVLVNDGSPDRCGEICDTYASKNSCVTVIHQENGGLSAARNTGLERASGEYVMFLDSDDYLEPNCLEVVYNRHTDLCIGSILYENEKGQQSFQDNREDEIIFAGQFPEKLPALLAERRLNYVHAKLYSRAIIEKYHLRFEDDQLTSAEDTIFNFTFLKHCRSIYVCSKTVHHYIQIVGGLGRKFYYDRYERHRRLNDYLTSVCREMGWLVPAMQEELNKRLVRGAIWTLSGIDQHSQDPYRIRKKALDTICSDDYLRKTVPRVNVEFKEDLTTLLQKGSKRYLIYKRMKRFYADLIRSSHMGSYIIKNAKKMFH